MKPAINTIDPQDLNLATRNTVGDMLTRVAERSPQHTAVVAGGRRVDYATFEREAEALARGILALEAAPAAGEPVALLLPNSYEFLVAYFGVAKSGRVVLPVNYGLAPADIAWLFADAGVRTVIVQASLLPILRAAIAAGAQLSRVIVHGAEAAALELPSVRVYELEELLATEVRGELRLMIRSEDVVQCLYTSGTTSRPKSALTTHSAAVTGMLSNALLAGSPIVWERPVSLIVLPLFHVTALNTLLTPVIAVGGCVVLHHGFDAAAVLDDIAAERVTRVSGIPMMWAAMAAEFTRTPRDLSSVVMASYGMAQMPAPVLAAMDRMMPGALKLLGSGQTEVVPATTFQRPEHQQTKNASWGVPVTTVRARIMDDEGHLLAANEIGEIVYRGPHVTAGYWRDSAANEQAFRHGWFHSGDVGYMDIEGVVWFTDRLKDVIKSGGENVSSMKVERVMAAAPGIVECCVIGTAHEHWGEAVTLVAVSDVLPEPGTVGDAAAREARASLEQALTAHAKQHLGTFEVPKRYEFVTELPKTSTGKVRKHTVRELIGH